MKKLLLILTSFLTLTASAQNDMETWVNFSAGLPPTQLTRPSGWFGIDSLTYTYGPFLFPGATFSKQTIKTTDKHSGSFAAMVLTDVVDTNVLPGLLTNANLDLDISTQDLVFEGGEPVTARIQYVNAWIKYTPGTGGDSASVTAFPIKTGAGAGGTDSTLGYGAMVIHATSNYTLISLPITYTDMVTVPDRIQVMFTSSADEGADSSTLYVDDVSYTFFPGGITGTASETVKCFPNPSNGIIYLTAPNAETYTWNAYSANGQLVGTKTFSRFSSVNMGHLPNGLYFYTISNKEGLETRTGKFVISK